LAGKASNFQYAAQPLFCCFSDTETIDEYGFAWDESSAIDRYVMVWELGLQSLRNFGSQLMINAIECDEVPHRDGGSEQ
jgi:hypothetical protein